MYLALYRKFRPETFEQVIGQEHIIRTLKNQIMHDQVGHAYLFCGSRGTGKTSVAKIFAKAVNCVDNKNGSPCGSCQICKNLAQTKDIDIIEIDAASNNRVDEVRDLRDKVKYPPLYGRYKVYIIDEVHMLTDSAFNALLKTLEEPPSHIIFILATTEPQKLPATILSRVLRFDFKLVGQNDLSGLLKNIFSQSGIKAEEEAITLIAQAGNGSVRDALSIADMCASYSNNNIKYTDVLEVLGTSDQQVLLNLTQSILDGNIAQFIQGFDKEVKSGKNIIILSADITKQLRDLLVVKANGVSREVVDLPIIIQEQLLKLSSKYSLAKINEALQAFSGIESELKYANSPQLLIEATAIGISHKTKHEDTGSVAKEYPQQEVEKNTPNKEVKVDIKKADNSKTDNQKADSQKADSQKTDSQKADKGETIKEYKSTENIKTVDEELVIQQPQSYIDYLDHLMEQENKKEVEKELGIFKKVNVEKEEDAPRRIWGQVLIQLHNINVILHAACVGIPQVHIKGDTFIIGADHESIVETIKKVENYNDLVACFSKLGYNYKINIINKKNVEKKVDKTELLSKKLGISVQVKNKK